MNNRFSYARKAHDKPFRLLCEDSENAIVKENLKEVEKEEARMLKVWKQYLKDIGSFTLMNVLEELGFEFQPEGSTNEFDQVQLLEADLNVDTGKPLEKPIYGKGIPALNAIRDFKKYAVLERDLHIAHFDPITDAHDVKVVRDRTTGLWTFWSWRDGQYVPSLLNMEDDEIRARYEQRDNPQFAEKMIGKKHAMRRKHDELNAIARAKKYGRFYRVVLGTDELETHYQTWIHDQLESTYAELRDELNTYYEEVESERKFRSGASPRRTRPNPNHQDFVKELSETSERVAVRYKTPSSKNFVTIFFDPTAPDSDEGLVVLDLIGNAPKSYSFEGFEPAPLEA